MFSQHILAKFFNIHLLFLLRISLINKIIISFSPGIRLVVKNWFQDKKLHGKNPRSEIFYFQNKIFLKLLGQGCHHFYKFAFILMICKQFGFMFL